MRKNQEEIDKTEGKMIGRKKSKQMTPIQKVSSFFFALETPDPGSMMIMMMTAMMMTAMMM